LFLTGITGAFLRQFALGCEETAPLLLSLGLGIGLLGYVVGRNEGWSGFESLYWSFITATTVGYGDLRPLKRASRVLAILIAFLGLMLTGIVIALAVWAATFALKTTPR
jgi:voltage-gated potassium channel